MKLIQPVLFLSFININGFGQDTRIVTEPHIPAICSTVTAALASQAGSLQVADESGVDTVRIQEAVDSCSPGNAVELRGRGEKNAFLSAPLE
jgi:polygalacturonase